MQCRLWTVLFCGASMLGLAGCMSMSLNMSKGFAQMAHSSEATLIKSFIDDLAKSDFDKLREVSSTDFKGSALRHEKAEDAFKMMNIPEGKVEIVKVTEKSEEEKRVLAKVGETKRKIYFDLIYDSKARKWVVDDIQFQKNLKPGQVNKTVTEQMDLLLSIQEYLDAWESGDRTQILATSTSDLRKTLEPLPAKSLKQFAAKVTTDMKRDAVKPEVEGHANMALVNVKRRSGSMLVTMRLENGKWLADDIAVESKKEEGTITSIRKQAHVLLTTIQFCKAYQTNNKSELERLSQTRFYRSVLLPGDITRMKLPITNADEEDYEVKLLLTRAEVLIKKPEQIIHLTLSQTPPERNDEGEPVEGNADTDKPFLVDEVTFHELKTKQEKRLSAVFSSEALVTMFAQSLANGDLKSLRFESTSDFQSRVWNRVELDDLADLTTTMKQIESERPVITDISFKGSTTEVTVNQGASPLTYVLRDQNGRLLVDDVLVPALDRPNSLKMNMEVMIPLRNFAKGLRTGDMQLVRNNASREFNKMVFQSMNRLPKIQSDPQPYLDEPLTQIHLTAERAILQLGDDNYGARVHMNKENDHYLIHDIVMISGAEKSQRAGLQQILRQLVLSGTRFGTAAAKNAAEPGAAVDNDAAGPVVLSSDRRDTTEREPIVNADLEEAPLNRRTRMQLDNDVEETDEPPRSRSHSRINSALQRTTRRADKNTEPDSDLNPIDQLEAELESSDAALEDLVPRRNGSDRTMEKRSGKRPMSRSKPIPSSDELEESEAADLGMADEPTGDDIDVIQPPR